jgi:dethiobiotin synthetase
MSLKIFVTGTDTDVGKTYISTGILKAFNKVHYSTLGIKPVASGCTLQDGILKNSDAIALQTASSIKLTYNEINPFALEPAIAPHIAAQQINYKLSVKVLKEKTAFALQHPADICVVEGAGGWYVPLNDQETIADFVKSVNLRVILVVGIRLGCLNHAILTLRAIQQYSIPVIGWIANTTNPHMKEYYENIATLKTWLTVPHLGTVGFQESVENNICTQSMIKMYF